jgi:hypothetical protein
VAAHVAAISDRHGEVVPDSGSAQGANEVAKALRPD